MIDIDKYEGHTPVIFANLLYYTEADAQLIADAPLLLAEVKRLRKGIWDAIYLFQEAGNPKMSDKKRLETICEFLVEVYDND